MLAQAMAFLAPAPVSAFFALTLSHRVNELKTTLRPQAAIVIANATWIPHAYARRTPSNSAPVYRSRNLVAPVAVTTAGSTFGAVVASLTTSWLANPDSAAAIRKVAPMDRKTVSVREQSA
jgi:hypothetical protein